MTENDKQNDIIQQCLFKVFYIMVVLGLNTDDWEIIKDKVYLKDRKEEANLYDLCYMLETIENYFEEDERD